MKKERNTTIYSELNDFINKIVVPVGGVEIIIDINQVVESGSADIHEHHRFRGTQAHPDQPTVGAANI